MEESNSKKKVSAAELEKALLEMTLEQEDEPFTIPDLPEYRSNVRNELSLVGRLLNPQVQKMERFILEMPRKWQLYDRVKGIALSRDRFQFLFKHEHDLVDILERGAHTYEMWSIVMERWVENPPPDYLQYLDLWVQMRNIPINNYTSTAITSLGEFAGRVIVVTFDPDKPQTRDYVRFKVRFDIAKPLRRVKVVNLPEGGSTKIRYDYERLQKMCYTCQRLTHDQSQCPMERLKIQLQSVKRSLGEPSRSALAELVIKESDPLFGVIAERQVGLDPMTGRPKIAKEVLDDMREYLMVAEGAEKVARQERVKRSLQSLENDPIGQKTMLRLEPLPLVTPHLDKGKGIVFNFEEKDKRRKKDEEESGSKLMAGAIRSGLAMTRESEAKSVQSAFSASPFFDEAGDVFQYDSTGFNVGVSDTGSSGIRQRKTKPRKRPGTYRRRARTTQDSKVSREEMKMKGKQEARAEKRKADSDVETSQHSAKFKKPLVVPNEGPSNP
ncbi:hypothetical protein Bca101_066819 [Brassica carinata]